MVGGYITMVAFDVETTGLDAELEEIIELGAVKFTFERWKEGLHPVELDSFAQLVKPSKPIPADVSAINHIFDEMVKEAPPLGQALPRFIRFCGFSSILVAHNASFDAEFIGRAIAAHRLPIPKNPIFDSLKLFRKISFEYASHKLGRIAERLQPELRIELRQQDLHRADYDCRVLAHVLAACLRRRFADSDLLMANAMKKLTSVHGKPLAFEDFA